MLPELRRCCSGVRLDEHGERPASRHRVNQMRPSPDLPAIVSSDGLRKWNCVSSGDRQREKALLAAIVDAIVGRC
jgi:hypothetical protein